MQAGDMKNHTLWPLAGASTLWEQGKLNVKALLIGGNYDRWVTKACTDVGS